jgi:hypothetical protein
MIHKVSTLSMINNVIEIEQHRLIKASLNINKLFERMENKKIKLKWWW